MSIRRLSTIALLIPLLLSSCASARNSSSYDVLRFTGEHFSLTERDKNQTEATVLEHGSESEGSDVGSAADSGNSETNNETDPMQPSVESRPQAETKPGDNLYPSAAPVVSPTIPETLPSTSPETDPASASSESNAVSGTEPETAGESAAVSESSSEEAPVRRSEFSGTYKTTDPVWAWSSYRPKEWYDLTFAFSVANEKQVIGVFSSAPADPPELKSGGSGQVFDDAAFVSPVSFNEVTGIGTFEVSLQHTKTYVNAGSSETYYTWFTGVWDREASTLKLYGNVYGSIREHTYENRIFELDFQIPNP